MLVLWVVLIACAMAVTSWVAVLFDDPECSPTRGAVAALKHLPTILIVGTIAFAASVPLAVIAVLGGVVAFIAAVFTCGALGPPVLAVGLAPLGAVWLALALVMPVALAEGRGPWSSMRRAIALVWVSRAQAVQELTLAIVVLLGAAYVTMWPFWASDGPTVWLWLAGAGACAGVCGPIAYGLHSAYRSLSSLDDDRQEPDELSQVAS